MILYVITVDGAGIPQRPHPGDPLARPTLVDLIIVIQRQRLTWRRSSRSGRSQAVRHVIVSAVANLQGRRRKINVLFFVFYCYGKKTTTTTASINPRKSRAPVTCETAYECVPLDEHFPKPLPPL